MRIDIRNGEQEEIDEIVFHDMKYTEGEACILRNTVAMGPYISGHPPGMYLYLVSETQVRNLIKALEKSLELGWYTE